MGIFSASAVVVSGGLESSIPADRHQDQEKPPVIGGLIATLDAAEDRDGYLAEAGNCDGSHCFKFTTAVGFAGGYAATIQFGYQYETQSGQGIAPMVFLDSSCPSGAEVRNVTSASYELHLPALAIGSTWRCSILVQERAARR